MIRRFLISPAPILFSSYENDSVLVLGVWAYQNPLMRGCGDEVLWALSVGFEALT